MSEVVLTVESPEGTRRVPFAGNRITFGRREVANVVISDDGLSRLHASINRDGDRVWVLDEHSTNGSFVNGTPVPSAGTPLKDGDLISIGHKTTILVKVGAGASAGDMASGVAGGAAAGAPGMQPNGAAAAPTTAAGQTAAPAGGGFLQWLLIIPIAGVLLLVIGIVAFSALRKSHGAGTGVDPNSNTGSPSPSPDGDETTATPGPGPSPAPSVEATPGVNTGPSPSNTAVVLPTGGSPSTTTPPTGAKLYKQMSPDEQNEFIRRRARLISQMMGNRPFEFNDEAVKVIKTYVDGFAHRVGNGSTKLWGEDLRFMFKRACDEYAPYIIRGFNERHVPPVAGLYLVVVETEYHNISHNNAAGAAGLFQFIGPTAEAYGVPAAERTNIAKMAPAAAAYLNDRMAEFGTDSMSLALGIAGYNRNPDSVRRDLGDVMNSENKERSFWTLVLNSNKLDKYFQGENIKYVPKYFAAAIVGETPDAFGLETPVLSTCTKVPDHPPPAGEPVN